MIDPMTLPGADMVLRLLYLRHSTSWGEDLLDEDNLRVGVTTHVWDEATEKHSWDGPERWYVALDCSDTFFWGSSDSEDVTPETLPVLMQTIEDVLPLYERMAAEDKASLEWSMEENKRRGEAWREAHPDNTDERYYRVQVLQDGTKHMTGLGGTEEKYVPASHTINHHRLSGPLCELYAARIRKMRPQGASYSYVPIELWPLFDACGPDRNTGLGNPTEPGNYNGPWSAYNKEHTPT